MSKDSQINLEAYKTEDLKTIEIFESCGAPEGPELCFLIREDSWEEAWSDASRYLYNDAYNDAYGDDEYDDEYDDNAEDFTSISNVLWFFLCGRCNAALVKKVRRDCLQWYLSIRDSSMSQDVRGEMLYNLINKCIQEAKETPQTPQTSTQMVQLELNLSPEKVNV